MLTHGIPPPRNLFHSSLNHSVYKRKGLVMWPSIDVSVDGTDEISLLCSELETSSSSSPVKYELKIINDLLKWCHGPFDGEAQPVLRVAELLKCIGIRWHDVTIWLRVVLAVKLLGLPNDGNVLDDKSILEAIQAFGLKQVEGVYVPLFSNQLQPHSISIV